MEQTVLSDKDGVTILSDIENNRYIVKMPNSYDIYWRFNDKNIATRLESEDKKVAVFAVPTDKLDEKGMDKFDEKVDEARKVFRDTKTEKSHFENVLGFDLAKEGKTVSFVYKNPPKGFCIGEVVKTGTYFIAQKSGEDAEKVYVRMINTNRFLNGKEDFENRESVIGEKFPIGSVKYLSFNGNGRITQTDYDPLKKSHHKEETTISVENLAEKEYNKRITAYEEKGMSSAEAKSVVDAEDLVKKIQDRELVNQKPSENQTLEQKKNLYMAQKMKH